MTQTKHTGKSTNPQAVKLTTTCKHCGEPNTMIFTKKDLKTLMKVIKTRGQIIPENLSHSMYLHKPKGSSQ